MKRKEESEEDSDDDITEGLTPWDYERKIRPVVTDDRLVAVSRHRLAKDVECAICLGIIRSPMTTMECLHRFCQDCIEKCLRMSKKECPACRTPLTSRRVLRQDANFEKMVNRLFPDRDAAEAEEEAAIQRVMARAVAPFAQAVEEGLRRQKEAAKLQRPASTTGVNSGEDAGMSGEEGGVGPPPGKRPMKSASTRPPSHMVTPSASPAPFERSMAGGVSIVLEPAAAAAAAAETTAPALERRFVSTSGDATVRTLCKYVAGKIGVAPEKVSMTIAGRPVEFDAPIGHIYRFQLGVASSGTISLNYSISL